MNMVLEAEDIKAVLEARVALRDFGEDLRELLLNMTADREDELEHFEVDPPFLTAEVFFEPEGLFEINVQAGPEPDFDLAEGEVRIEVAGPRDNRVETMDASDRRFSPAFIQDLILELR